MENEFNINLLYSTIPESITVHHLLKDIKIAPDILRVIILRLITDFLLLRNEQGAQSATQQKQCFEQSPAHKIAKLYNRVEDGVQTDFYSYRICIGK